MADPTILAGVAPFGLAFAILLVGAVCGYAGHLLGRLPGVAPELANAWAVNAALSAAATASSVVAVAAGWHLISCGGPPATQCASSATVIPLAAPVDGVPALSLTIHLDGLAALFLAVVGFCGACVAVYSFGWLRDDPLRHNVSGSFNLFLAATSLTILVDNIFWLFIALELVTLCSADLVRYQGRRHGRTAASRTAVHLYLLVGHVGLVCLVAGLLPAAVREPKLDFGDISAAGGSPWPALSFTLVLLGLSARAGVTPFHFWVPTVHPQLPTNMHAMMSAVMLKVPVYLMIRIFFTGIIGPVVWWWGAVVLVLAGATALITVFYAMVCKDLKTALAYHSVENIGIILAGVGLALLFSDAQFDRFPAIRGAAALALLASLYHVVNHALFKSLLFLGTGSIERQTGTVVTSQLGAMLRRAPWTGISFLVGAAAIAGLPPLNGFISEWLTLQSLFGGQATYHARAPVALVSMAAVVIALITLAMAIAVTALAFVKIAGESLLGEPRGGADLGGETWSMRGVMLLLAGLCLVLGLQPWLLVPWLVAATVPLGYDVSVLTATPAALTIQLPADPDGVGAYQATLPTLPLLLLGGLAVLLTVLLRVAGFLRRPVWVGGRPFEPHAMQYTGSAMSSLLWERVSREPAPAREAPLDAAFRLSPRRGVVEFASHLYNRLLVRISAGSRQIGERLQGGDIRSYLLYIFGAVMLVLLVLAVIR